MKIKNKKSGYIGEISKESWDKMANQFIPNSQTTTNPKGVSFQTLYTIIEEPKNYKVTGKTVKYGTPSEYKTPDDSTPSEN